MTTTEVTTVQAGKPPTEFDATRMLDQIDRAVEEGAPAKTWVGTLLRFNKGDYLIGRDKDVTVVPLGTKFTLAIDTWEQGWEKWWNKELVDRRTGFVYDGFSRPARDDLGDNDPEHWPINARSGKPEDPWQRVDRVVMYAKKGDEGGLYTFSTRSWGGIEALRKLMERASRIMRMEHPHDYPIVQLESDSYRHPNYGKIDTPEFAIVGWDSDRWLGAELRKDAA
jgi:hypothetical protein